MRFLILATLIASFLSPTLSAQRDVNQAKDQPISSEHVANRSGIWSSILNMLDAQEGPVSYEEFDSLVLSKFDCKNEFDRTSIGTEGDDKGFESRWVKSHCQESATIEYSGRSHYRLGDKPFRYNLNLFWFPTCLPADAALNGLRAHGWVIQDERPPFIPGNVPVNYEPMPNTETFRSRTSSEFLSIAWRPKDNPYRLQNVDPSRGCLNFVQIGSR